MIIYELKEGYIHETCQYESRQFFETVEGLWEYLTMDDDTYTYLYRTKELTFTILRNNMSDHRHSRTIVSGRGKRYEVTSYEIIEKELEIENRKDNGETYIS